MSSHALTELSAEQQLALRDPGRITIIRAGPGTGKTRLFVTEFQRRLATWNRGAAGIAALSFTNAARDEIAERLGGLPPPPHFVGTLDAFVWRFVVRPFAHTVGVTAKGARLVPAPLHLAIERPSIQVGANNKDRASIFRLILQLDDGRVRVVRESRWGSEMIDPSYVNGVVAAKKDEWLRNGRLTHSDCQALGAKILRGVAGERVADLLARRFPVLLVDEFQDTNRFLSMVLLKLLATETVSAVLVGDRDQAIYSFGGADRNLFQKAEKLSGAVGRPLRETHRFGACIADVAAFLSRSGEAVVPHDEGKVGRAVLLVHDGKDVEPTHDTRTKLLALVGQEPIKTAAFLARKNAWLDQFDSASSTGGCPLRCKAGGHLHRATVLLHQGNSAGAAGLVERNLCQLVLDGAEPTANALRAAGVASATWRQAIRRLLFEAVQTVEGESWGAWLMRMKASHQREVSLMNDGLPARAYSDMFKRGFRKGQRDRARTTEPELAAARSWESLTIHAAKGRQFDAAIVFWPRPGGRAKVKCPSEEWWSESSESEEREVAYVAVTRARHLLVLCVHEATLNALQQKQPRFVERFEIVGAPTPTSL